MTEQLSRLAYSNEELSFYILPIPSSETTTSTTTDSQYQLVFDNKEEVKKFLEEESSLKFSLSQQQQQASEKTQQPTMIVETFDWLNFQNSLYSYRAKKFATK